MKQTSSAGDAGMGVKESIMRAFFVLFGSDKKFQAALAQKASARREAIEREVVARFSRGNIRLQEGLYLTREQIDEELEWCIKHAQKYGD